jgi:hypothetical protein
VKWQLFYVGSSEAEFASLFVAFIQVVLICKGKNSSSFNIIIPLQLVQWINFYYYYYYCHTPTIYTAASITTTTTFALLSTTVATTTIQYAPFQIWKNG